MKKLALTVVAILTVVSLSFAAPKAKTFTGEIMDSQCAMMGSHDTAGYKMTNTNNP